MKIRKIYYIAIIALAGSIFQSCSDWLSLQPIDRQTEEQLFSTKDGFYAALNGIYNKLGSDNLYGKQLTWEMIDIIAQRYAINTNYDLGSKLAAFTYSDASVQSIMESMWTEAYNTILNCNVLIKNCEDKNGTVLTQRDYSIIKAESLTARAFLHFDMLRCFGPIYVTSPEGTSIPYNTLCYASTLPLLPANQVVANVLSDIDAAIELLADNDPVITEGVMNTPATTGDEYGDIYRYRQLRFNYYSALLLKARVLLYSGDLTNALAAAKILIDDPVVTEHFPFVDPSRLLGNSSTPDRTFSTEMLFGLYNQNRGLIFRNNFSPEGTTTKLLQPRSSFVAANLFLNETQDYRYQSQWAASNAIGNTDPMFIKYMDISDNELFYATVFPLMRISEAYYIAAECETNLTNAYGYLNVIREKRGVTPLSVVSASDLNTKLNNEYNREFAGEGQLFFYYKRRNVSIPNAQNGRNTSTYSFNDARGVFPLPENEMTVR